MKDNKVLHPNDPRVIRIKQLAAEGKITYAPDDQVQQLEAEVNVVLAALGYPDALVSDLSCVNDFGLSIKEINTVANKLGFDVSRHDFIVDLAKKVKLVKHNTEQYNGY